MRRFALGVALVVGLSFAMAPETRGEAGRAPTGGVVLPRGREIRSVTIARCAAGATALTEDGLRRVMDRARPLDIAEPTRDGWQYAPWCAGSFDTPRGTYRFVLFLGGRGDLTLPGGVRVRFEFDPEGLAPARERP